MQTYGQLVPGKLCLFGVRGVGAEAKECGKYDSEGTVFATAAITGVMGPDWLNNMRLCQLELALPP
jgi:hypothetical protein